MTLHGSHAIKFLAAVLTSGLLAGPTLSQGTLQAWGFPGSFPNQLPEGSDFISVVAGGGGALALRADGSLVAWGSNTLVPYPTGTDFVEIAVRSPHALARRADGTLEAWGSAGPPIGNVPVAAGFTHIAIGDTAGMALRGDGSFTTWGSDVHGLVTNSPTGTGFVQLAAGRRHCLALHSDGTIHAWGASFEPQVNGAPTGAGFTFIASGLNHSVALRSDGSLVSWGTNYGGEITDTPTGTGFVHVAAGYRFSSAVRPDGTIVSWGWDPGNGVVTGTPTDDGFFQVAAGAAAGVALRESPIGTAFCFGDGTGAVCPCSSFSNAGRGCRNSAGKGALLRAMGNARVTKDSFSFRVSGVPASRPGLIFRGANQLSGGLGVPVGDGLLCTSAQIARSQVQQVGLFGASNFTHFKGAPFGASIVGVGVPTNYQFWYRDPQGACSGSGFNLSNAWTVTWLP